MINNLNISEILVRGEIATALLIIATVLVFHVFRKDMDEVINKKKR